ncbi:MAG TPA: hypothetical protein VL985_07790 [Stellaceae bacterium]|nr:hypothetical protein [Stellaceae bacterium]
MSKVNIIVLALVSLVLAHKLAFGQGGNVPSGVRENAATSGERMIMERAVQAAQSPSRIAYLRLYCTPDNNSHFQSVTGKLGKSNFAPPASPLYIGNNIRAATAFFGGFDAGWGAHDLATRLYHPTPAVQFLIILDGDFSITASDGEMRRFRPGDVLRLEDTAPCRGHITVVGDKPGFTMFVR